MAAIDDARRKLNSYRSKARQYGNLGENYAPWMAYLKVLVNNASDDDFGTFIAAAACIENVVPRNIKREVDREAKLVELEEQYRKDVESNSNSNRFECMSLAIGACIICAVVWIMLLQQDYLPFIEVSNFCPFLTSDFMLVFSLLGAASSGYILGVYSDKDKLREGSGIALSILFGILSTFVCCLLPPVAFVLAWWAWRISDVMQPFLASEHPRQVDLRDRYGIRIFAEDIDAPEFVKNAVRLAGFYCNLSGNVGVIANQTLIEPQCNYGAFVVYNALLSEYWVLSQAEIKAQRELEDISEQTGEEVASNGGDSGGTGGTGAGTNANGSSHIYNGYPNIEPQTSDLDINESDGNVNSLKHIFNFTDDGVIKFCGVVSALLAGLIVGGAIIGACFICPTSMTVMLIFLQMGLGAPFDYMSIVILILPLVVCVIIGLRSAKRVSSIYGLGQSKRQIVAIARSAWFSAIFIFISVITLACFIG